MLALTLRPDGRLILHVPSSDRPRTIVVRSDRKTRLSITADRSVVIARDAAARPANGRAVDGTEEAR